MPVYNNEKTISNTIKSILSQTFKDFELYIYDDASTDNTYSILSEFAKNDSRIHIYRNTINQGLHPNFNNIKYLNEFKYVALMSGNDIIYPDYYKKCIEFLEKNDDYISCCSQGTNTINNDCSMCSFELDNTLERAIELIQKFDYGNYNFGVFRRSMLDMVLPYDSIMGADHVYMFNCSLIGKIKVLDDVLFERDIPDRTRDKYREICHSSIKSHPDLNCPIFKISELFLGHIDVCLNGYLNGINRDILLKLVIKSLFKRFRKNLMRELRKLQVYMFFHKFINHIDYFQLNLFRKKLRFYYCKDLRFKLCHPFEFLLCILDYFFL